MDSTSILSGEEVIKLVSEILFKSTKEHLNNTETVVLNNSHRNRTYEQMGGSNYDIQTLKDAGSALWKKLSNALGVDVKKSNFVQVLKHYKDNPKEYTIHSQPKATPTPTDSPIYIKRGTVESSCYEKIQQDGALIRIRSAQRMGKTLLLGKLLDYATQQGYQTAKLDLQFVDDNTLADLNTFMKWLCDEVLNNLNPQPDEEEYWQAFNKLNGNLTRFFQKYLLPKLENPLVLAIDSFEKLFKANIYSTFCSYLRGWHDNAKPGDNIGNIWKKLRVVLVYSTETYPDLDTNHSPFNAGVPIDLPDFNCSEVTTLAKQYKLDEHLGENGLSKLMELVGGHPYFIQEAFSNLKNQQMTLEDLLSFAPTEQGIYSHYLRQQLWNLQQNHQLELAYKNVVMANEPVRLDNTEVAFKLHSMGLVKFSRNNCIPSYDLLRQYFSEHLE